MKSDVKVNFNAPLSKDDTPTQTVGCRANNPDICRFYMLEGSCAFVRNDGLCIKPSRSWKKQYEKLKGGQDNGE